MGSGSGPNKLYSVQFNCYKHLVSPSEGWEGAVPAAFGSAIARHGAIAGLQGYCLHVRLSCVARDRTHAIAAIPAGPDKETHRCIRHCSAQS